ncbi:MAG: Rad52/Rad22 family DNA repair protein [Chloroflexota bacterium]
MEKRARGKAAVADQEETRATPEQAVDQDGLREFTPDDTTVPQADLVHHEAAQDGPPEAELYGRLATPFDITFRDLRGGVELEYITGEQVATRLNEELGFLAWSFKVLEHGIHAEADECWVLGELTVELGGRTVTRQQFGSQKVKRSRSSGTPMDIGFDLKGAATDAMKKCASLVGVGLYLWKKEPPAGLGNGGRPVAGGGNGSGSNGNGNYGSNGAANGMHVVGGNAAPAAGASDYDTFACEECGEPLTETRFKDGTNWPPSQLAVFGRRKHSRVLCMTHYREANQAKRRAEEALQHVPF